LRNSRSGHRDFVDGADPTPDAAGIGIVIA